MLQVAPTELGRKLPPNYKQRAPTELRRMNPARCYKQAVPPALISKHAVTHLLRALLAAFCETRKSTPASAAKR